MEFCFDSFMVCVWDELDVMYGLLVEMVEVLVDKNMYIFNLCLEVCFYDGLKLMVEDVVFFFNFLKVDGYFQIIQII